MNEELGNFLRTRLLDQLLRMYQGCQVFIRYVDDYNILQITLHRKITACTTWTYNRVYINPLIELSRCDTYADDVYFDFLMHADRWILNKFKKFEN